jgi:hypothetical protein
LRNYSSAETSNKIIQKGLELIRKQSGSVTVPGRDKVHRMLLSTKVHSHQRLGEGPQWHGGIARDHCRRKDDRIAAAARLSLDVLARQYAAITAEIGAIVGCHPWC